jgi:hypothetical protein
MKKRGENKRETLKRIRGIAMKVWRKIKEVRRRKTSNFRKNVRTTQTRNWIWKEKENEWKRMRKGC